MFSTTAMIFFLKIFLHFFLRSNVPRIIYPAFLFVYPPSVVRFKQDNPLISILCDSNVLSCILPDLSPECDLNSRTPCLYLPQIPRFRIVRTSNGEVHAEFLVVVSIGSHSTVTFGLWRRHSDFNKLAMKVRNSVVQIGQFWN
jgi:hypothetical protein